MEAALRHQLRPREHQVRDAARGTGTRLPVAVRHPRLRRCSCRGADRGIRPGQNPQSYSNCGSSDADNGHFQFTFNPDPAATGPGFGQYEAKGDLYQIGGGHGGQFWYSHTRDIHHLGGDSGRMTSKGTWTLDKSMSCARAMVHLPDTGAQTRQALYVIGGSDSTSPGRIVEQHASWWVSLGAFHFTGTPPLPSPTPPPTKT